MNVCRPALPPPPKPVTPGMMSGESLDRFLETPNDGSTWKDGVLVFAAGWNVFGPRMGEERSSPYATRNGDGEEGRWRLSIVDGRGSAGGSLMRPTGWTRWASEGVTGVAADRSHADSVSRVHPRSNLSSFPENSDNHGRRYGYDGHDGHNWVRKTDEKEGVGSQTV